MRRHDHPCPAPSGWLAVIAFALLLQGCASDSTGHASAPPPTECPQPRFTGEAPESIRSADNPLTASRQNVASGRALYQGGVAPACHLCHGREGDGRGPLSTQFKPRPRNFACEATISGIPDGQLYWIIRNGSPGTAMPGFEDKLTEEESWQIVLYLRELAAR